jgi:hypothetical protein
MQIAKASRALKKLAVLNPTVVLATRVVHAFLAASVDPANKSSSWLARRLKAHLPTFLSETAPAPTVETPAVVVVDQPVVTAESAEPAPKVVKAKKSKATKQE